MRRPEMSGDESCQLATGSHVRVGGGGDLYSVGFR